MKTRTAIALFAMLIFTSARLHAQSSDHAKVINLTSNDYSGPPIVVPNGEAPIAISTSSTNWVMTLSIDDIAYSFYLRQTRKLKTRDFIVGDFVAAHVDKDKMVVRLQTAVRRTERSSAASDSLRLLRRANRTVRAVLLTKELTSMKLSS